MLFGSVVATILVIVVTAQVSEVISLSIIFLFTLSPMEELTLTEHFLKI